MDRVMETRFNDEVWKIIEDFPNYAVSNLGRVANIKRKNILKNCNNGNGYYYVSLGKYNNQYVHRLVAIAFIPNVDNKPEIDHINTIRTDNRVENLRWVTKSENQKNPLTIIKQCNKVCSDEVRQKISNSLRIKLNSPDINSKMHKKHNMTQEGLNSLRSKKSKPIIQYKDGQIVNRFNSITEAVQLGYDSKSITKCCKGIKDTYKGFNWSYDTTRNNPGEDQEKVK